MCFSVGRATIKEVMSTRFQPAGLDCGHLIVLPMVLTSLRPGKSVVISVVTLWKL